MRAKRERNKVKLFVRWNRTCHVLLLTVAFCPQKTYTGSEFTQTAINSGDHQVDCTTQYQQTDPVVGDVECIVKQMLKREGETKNNFRLILYVASMFVIGVTIIHFALPSAPSPATPSQNTLIDSPPRTSQTKKDVHRKPISRRSPTLTPPTSPPKPVDVRMLSLDDLPSYTLAPSNLSLCSEMREITQTRLFRRQGREATYPIPLSDVHYPKMEDIAPKIIEECSSASHPNALNLPRCQDPTLFYQVTFRYPPYEMAYPNFIRQSDRSLFRRLPPILNSYHPEHSNCPVPDVCDPQPYEQDLHSELVMWSDDVTRGQVSIVSNGTYYGKPTASFGVGACEKKAQYQWIIPQKAQHKEMPFDYPRIGLAVGPQSSSFQHFINRLLPRLIQAWDWIRPDRSYEDGGGYRLVVPPGEQAGVQKLWRILGFEYFGANSPNGTLLKYTSRPLKSQEMLFPCVNPHWHPWHYRRMQELVQVNSSIPYAERTKILYLTRKNNSRKVLNEAAVLKAIRETVKALDESWEVIVFEHKQYPTAADLRRLFSQVRAIIGPHGGAWYNSIWAPPETLVIELLPVQGSAKKPRAMRWPEVMWWIARFFGHRHWSVPVITKAAGDITVDPQRIVDILHCAL